MEDVASATPNLDAYRRRSREGWHLVDVDSTDHEIILTMRKGASTLILPLTAFEAAKLAGFEELAAEVKLRDILVRRRSREA